MRWARIDRAAKTIRLEPGEAKNREGRTFPYGLPRELAEVIEARWREHERLLKIGTICPFVFNRGGKPIRYFYNSWRNACEKAGVRGSYLTISAARP